MRQVVSCDEGYSFFIDKKEVVFYETGRHMTGQDIADVLDISKGAVSQNLKRALRKVYRFIRNSNRRLLSPVEVVMVMAEMLDIRTETQYQKFFKLFDNDIKGEISADAYKYFGQYRN